MDYIFTLTFRQLPSHIELFELSSLLPNLTKLDIVYGVKKVGWINRMLCISIVIGTSRLDLNFSNAQVGMNYERMLFGMKISDATSLAKIFHSSETLTTVILAGK